MRGVKDYQSSAHKLNRKEKGFCRWPGKQRDASEEGYATFALEQAHLESSKEGSGDRYGRLEEEENHQTHTSSLTRRRSDEEKVVA